MQFHAGCHFKFGSARAVRCMHKCSGTLAETARSAVQSVWQEEAGKTRVRLCFAAVLGAAWAFVMQHAERRWNGF